MESRKGSLFSLPCLAFHEGFPSAFFCETGKHKCRRRKRNNKRERERELASENRGPKEPPIQKRESGAVSQGTFAEGVQQRSDHNKTKPQTCRPADWEFEEKKQRSTFAFSSNPRRCQLGPFCILSFSKVASRVSFEGFHKGKWQTKRLEKNVIL